MLKRRIVTLLFCIMGVLILSESTTAQNTPYNAHTWVNPQQTYIKFKVWKRGVFRVDGKTLFGLNLPDNVPTNVLHLFRKGKEVPIFIRDRFNDGVINETDYIEFYGEPNDGTDDGWIYRDAVTAKPDPTLQTNAYVSLFSDTASYFLTWDNTPRQAKFTINHSDITNFELYEPLTQGRFIAHVNYTSVAYLGAGSYHNPLSYGYSLNSDYVLSEGFTGPLFTTPYQLSISTPFPATKPTQDPDFSFRVSTVSFNNHVLRVNIGSRRDTFRSRLATINTYSYALKQSDLAPSTTVLFTPSGDNPDVYALSWMRIAYDREFKLNNEREGRFLYYTNEGRTLTFTGVAGKDTAYVYDLRNGLRISGRISAGQLRVVNPATDTADVFLSTEEAILENSRVFMKVERPVFTHLTNPDAGAEFVIITAKYLRASADAYAEYRQNNPFNRMSSKVVFVDEIYELFGYGDVTPLAIKRFCYYALQNWNTKPKYFFLWGKGRAAIKQTGGTNVPAWGQPASDFEYVSNFTPELAVDLTPLVPIGRINARSNAEGMTYLAKIKQYESTPFQPWMKNGVHLGGGYRADNEQKPIRFCLERAEAIYEDYPFGGNIFYYQKNSNQVVDNQYANLVRENISNGINILTFFGHSTATIYDVEIQEPYYYNNWGKYPFILANGCYPGDFINNESTFGERFINQPGRGAIGYLSSSSNGFLSQMCEYTNQFYGVTFRDFIGEAIGHSVRRTIQRFVPQAGGVNSAIVRNHAKQINLQCDPSLKLYTPTKPDLAIRPSDVYTEPAQVAAQSPTFKLNLIVRNAGIGFKDSFTVRIVRRLRERGGVVIDTIIQRFPPVLNLDTLTVVIPNNPKQDLAGLNTLEIFLDPTSATSPQGQIPEMIDSLNNAVTFTMPVYSRLPICLDPFEFAVVNRQTLDLKVATFGIKEDQLENYEIEIDTVIEFNSSMRRNSGVIRGSTLGTTWRIPYPLKDSAVYYWRVRIPDGSPGTWVYSSFKYIEGQYEGWAQSRPPQFFEDPTVNITMNQVKRIWEFEKEKISLYAALLPGAPPQLYLDAGQRGFLYNNGTPGVFFSVIDGATIFPRTFQFDLGNVDWVVSPTYLPTLISIIRNLKDGDYFLLYNFHGNTPPTQWPEGLFEALKTLGATDKLKKAGNRFIFLGRKGWSYGMAQEIITSNTPGGDGFVLNTALTTGRTRGEIYTKTIGPSNKWLDLIWDWTPSEPVPADNITVSVYGIDKSGNEVLLPGLQHLARGNHDLRGIDPKIYPYLKLKADCVDTTFRTAPQLKHWHVLYWPAGDLLLDPQTPDFAFEKQTVRQGEPIFVRISGRNVARQKADSIKVRFEVINQHRERVIVGEKIIASLPPDGTAPVDLTFLSYNDSIDFSGKNTLVITINPDFDYPENFYFNNIYTHEFYVIKDRINPLLDVNFDGKPQTDCELVSSNPTIHIKLTDDDRFFLLRDTSAFEIFIKKANDFAPPTRIFFGQVDSSASLLTFIPAEDGSDNTAQAIFRPKDLPDGEYILELTGYDHNNNPSGRRRYMICFKIRSQSVLTDVLPTPNPFSSQVRFTYLLTGRAKPSSMVIDIFTLTGNLVQSLDLAQSDDIKFGRYTTQAFWDGKDNQGNTVGTGVYPFRVTVTMPDDYTIRKDGQPESQAAKTLTLWGKLYFIR